MVEIAGHSYVAVIGSDLKRDGMYLEITNSFGADVAGVFYSDEAGRLTFTAWQQDLPLELVEWAVSYGRERLTPIRGKS